MSGRRFDAGVERCEVSDQPTVDATLAKQIARELALPIVEELLGPLAEMIAVRLSVELRTDGQSLGVAGPGASSGPDGASERQSLPRLVDAQTLAGMLGVSRDCIYDHVAQLGGRRIGAGPRGRLRFNLDEALAAWTTRTASSELPAEPAAAAHRRARRRRGSESDGLLPIKGALVSRQEAS